MAETLDQRAERLRDVGIDLACRMRDDDPAAVRRHLDSFDQSERDDLVLLLAAMVPVDVPVSVLLGWWQHPRPDAGPRCGTVPAARRHQGRGEPLDEACGWALREADRVRTRVRRAAS